MDYYIDARKQREAYEADNKIIKPDERYNFEQIMKLNNYDYLETMGYFIDTEEDLEAEAQNVFDANESDLKNKD